MNGVRLTHIGGPTVLLEVGGWRFLTDPTFDLLIAAQMVGPSGNVIGVERQEQIGRDKAAAGKANMLTNYHVIESVWSSGGRKVFLERGKDEVSAIIERLGPERRLGIQNRVFQSAA